MTRAVIFELKKRKVLYINSFLTADTNDKDSEGNKTTTMEDIERLRRHYCPKGYPDNKVIHYSGVAACDFDRVINSGFPEHLTELKAVY